MKLIQNTGTQRVIDLMQPHLKHGNRLDCVTPSFSAAAFMISSATRNSSSN